MKNSIKDADTIQMTHKEMVKKVADYLVEKGLNDVRAKVESYPQPGLINDIDGKQGYFPDITAYANQLLIVEVVSTELIIEVKKKQWEFFDRYANTHNSVFIIAVPKTKTEVIKSRLDEMNIHASIWEI